MTSTLPRDVGDIDSPAELSSTSHAVPDVEGDGHHGVEDDDVGPEREEGGQTGIVAVRIRQEHCEIGACVCFPEVVSYCQDAAHEDQESKNL